MLYLNNKKDKYCTHGNIYLIHSLTPHLSTHHVPNVPQLFHLKLGTDPVLDQTLDLPHMCSFTSQQANLAFTFRFHCGLFVREPERDSRCAPWGINQLEMNSTGCFPRTLSCVIVLIFMYFICLAIFTN